MSKYSSREATVLLTNIVDADLTGLIFIAVEVGSGNNDTNQLAHTNSIESVVEITAVSTEQLKCMIADYQFLIFPRHSTVEQVHRV